MKSVVTVCILAAVVDFIAEMNCYSEPLSPDPVPSRSRGIHDALWKAPFNITKCLIAVVIILHTYKVYIQWKLPKGPFPWPIIGNVDLFIPTKGDNTGSKRLWKLSQKLNSDIISLKFWNKQAIVLNKYADIKRAFTDEEFQHRTDVFFTTELVPGILGNEGVIWKEQKKFFIRVLHKINTSGKLEYIIHTEVEKLIEELKQKKGRATDPCDPIVYTCGNIINQIIYGESCDLNDPNFQSLIDLPFNVISRAQYAIGWGLLDISRYIPSDYFPFRKIRRAMNLFYNKSNEKYQDALGRGQDGDGNSYLDKYIKVMKSNEKQDLDYSDKQLLRNLFEFSIPSVALISAILRWSIVAMIHHPDVQKKVRAEIHDNIPMDRLPRKADRSKLPYTEATLTEIWRTNIIQQMTTTLCSANYVTHFKGYTLPPRTLVMANWYAVHNDPTHWDKPEVFNPDRFLDENNCFKKDKHFVPFSLGARACPGLLLANTEMFITFATLMQQFEITQEEGTELPSLEPVLGSASQQPQPYRACFLSETNAAFGTPGE